MNKAIQKITPFLWFDHQAEEAANFYVSIFEHSKILTTNRYDEAGANASGMPKGSAMVVDFELSGQRFSALNGGPMFTFSPATSFLVNCETQKEVDHYWEKLSDGGKKGQCGWLDDKFGVTWQIVPTALGKLLSDPDASKAQRVMAAMLTMTKINIAELQKAYDDVN